MSLEWRVLSKRKSCGWARRKNSKTRIRYMEAMTPGAVVANDQPEVTANEDVYVEDHAIPAVIPQSLLQPPSQLIRTIASRDNTIKRERSKTAMMKKELSSVVRDLQRVTKENETMRSLLEAKPTTEAENRETWV